eukprot:m.283926 g.283926  ORF g.283926 m.283926 type:complete len:115 (+) comp17763_c1_seq9:810-1154(+)
MYRHLSSKVDFHLVYIAEAHATDEWPISYPTVTAQHATATDRQAALDRFVMTHSWTVPSSIDDVDDTASTVLGAWPFRLYIGHKGNVVYQGMPEDCTYSTTTLYERLTDLGVSL